MCSVPTGSMLLVSLLIMVYTSCISAKSIPCGKWQI